MTTAFWGFTINNYTDTHVALLEQGYPDYMRELVYTFEKGDSDTPHIQGWLKLQRQQRLSFVRKLFPGAHFTALVHDEYIANMKKYAQKLDSTAQSAAIHKYNEPMKTIEGVVKQVAEIMLHEMTWEESWDTYPAFRKRAEKKLVAEKDYKYAKIFVSSTYKAMWNEFGREMLLQLVLEHQRKNDTHTHTRNNIVVPMIHNHASNNSQGEGDEEDKSESDCQDYEDGSGSEDEGYAESGSSSSSASYD